MKLTKNEAIQKLEALVSRIPSLETDKRFSEDFKKWQHDARVVLKYVFPNDREYIKEFDEIRYSLAAFVIGATPDSEFQEAFRSGLGSARAMLQARIDEVTQFWRENDLVPETDNRHPNVPPPIIMGVPTQPRRVGDAIPDDSEGIERDIDYWTNQLAECSGGSERHHQVDSRLKKLARAKERLSAALAKSPSPPSRRVFMGHGGSLVWHQLKAFLTDRLHLACDEFNSESVAGISTTERLQTLLDRAGFAFLVMTAEDIFADSSTHARENVIHEAGLFQGRLGFKRAIILLEDGCAQFSNIHGLTYIGFPKGNLEPVFERIRHVLEREGILQSPLE
jgi:predicted nucleotide-binding protein